jgi:tripeptide aminopeptidase
MIIRRSRCKARTIPFILFMLAPMLAAATTPKISSETENAFSKLQANPQVEQGLEFIKNDDANTIAEQKAIVAIPAPPFK